MEIHITLPFGPYDAREYTNSSHLGSVHFDGTGDSLNFTTTADLQALGTGTACTVEGWVYVFVSGNGTALYSQGSAGSRWSNILEFGLKSDRRVRAFINGGTLMKPVTQFAQVQFLKVWTHLAYERRNQTWTFISMEKQTVLRTHHIHQWNYAITLDGLVGIATIITGQEQ